VQCTLTYGMPREIPLHVSPSHSSVDHAHRVHYPANCESALNERLASQGLCCSCCTHLGLCRAC
jgi:hypothetical protein